MTRRELALVTGVAGFIGSTLAERLIDTGWDVLGVDCFTPYYDRSQKEANLLRLRRSCSFRFIEADLRTADLHELLGNAAVVFHQAAQPGVRLSWSEGFLDYESHNILVTQRLLEAAKRLSIRRFVYASSSSVYGNAARYPTTEMDLPQPHSPYGVTKLAGEQLCSLYAANWAVPTVSLRYFSVYGPRQRPDMAMHRLLQSVITGASFPLYGSGNQVRDFTYVDDVVAANIKAATSEIGPGTVINVGGGGSISLSQLIELIQEIAGRPVMIDAQPEQQGDVERTGGAIDAAFATLGWRPEVDLKTGLSLQLDWHRLAERSLTG